MRKTLSSFISGCFRKFMNFGITKKLILLYLFVILLPTSLLLSHFYKLNMASLEQSYYESQQNILLSAKETLSAQMTQISSAYNYYQQSDALSELLNGAYPDASSTLYYYFKDLVPLFKSTKINGLIKNVGIYGYKEYSLNMKYGFGSVDMLDRDESFLASLPVDSGLWEICMEKGADSPTLRFYRNIYTNIYPYNRGVLVFYVNPYDFFDSFYSQVQCPFYFSVPDGSYIGYNNGVFIRYDEKPQALTDTSSKIQELRFPDGCPVMEIPILPLDTVKARSQFLPLALVVPLILFTVFYFLMNLSINRRLGGFTRHLQNASAEELMPFETTPYQDEIGIAIKAYNNMLARTNSLIHENLKVRIQKQNSDYYALQAQIKPHFLYNILENIRMNAEAHNDSSTADMLLLLGRHMRYNLNMSWHPLHLEEELYAARNYLQIHEIRMKDKINYEISIATEIDDVWCPRFLLQPLLENAIQHGYALDRPLHICVSVTESENQLWPDCVRVVIEDNGNGISPERLLELQEKLRTKTLEEERHVGLLNVNGRLSSFLQTKKGAITISGSPDKGTSIVFYLKRGKPDESIDC